MIASKEVASRHGKIQERTFQVRETAYKSMAVKNFSTFWRKAGMVELHCTCVKSHTS